MESARINAPGNGDYALVPSSDDTAKCRNSQPSSPNFAPELAGLDLRPLSSDSAKVANDLAGC